MEEITDSDNDSDCILEMGNNGEFQPQIKNTHEEDVESIKSNFIPEFSDNPYIDEYNIKKYKKAFFNKKTMLSPLVRKSSISNTNIESTRNILKNINFDSNFNENTQTLFYNLEKLKLLNFIDIYNILIESNNLIFVKNKKITKKLTKNYIDSTFLPIEISDFIIKNINILNNSILNEEDNTILCIGIAFDNNEILINTLYKKIEIKNTQIFFPIEKYNLKEIEYKIKGFSQIVEELGAKSINIKFQKNNLIKKTKLIKTKISSDIELLAGNLGLNRTSENSTNEKHDYNLYYPANNTINLNESSIKNKIKNKQFIINNTTYNSNLELQYLIQSRCKYLIEKYSTVFTFNNSNTLDRKFFINLKSYGIKLNINYNEYSLNKMYISIVTNVTFSSLNDCKNIINGTSVSLDSIGFGFLMTSIGYSGDFETNGIFKIIVFLNKYIDNVIKTNNSDQYKVIYSIIKKIKIQLTLNEFADLLCKNNYFTKTSQWIHFINFLDILSNKTRSYDKLGYIVIVNNDTISIVDKLNIILYFIQQQCIERGIEDKYYQMMQPYNIKLKNELKNKLLYEYDFIQYYNWYNLNMLIKNIEMYTINFNTTDSSKNLSQLITNMNLGYKYWEFNNNIIPFIIKTTYLLKYTTSNDVYINRTFLKSINLESFISNKINIIDDLTDYIYKKISTIKESYNFAKSINYPLCVEDFYNILIDNNFIEKNPYLNHKLNIILGEKTLDNLQDWIEFNSIKDINIMYYFINKLICYNEKLNNNLISNYLSYEYIYKNYISGIKKKEFNKIIVPFITNLLQDLSISEIILKNISVKTFNIKCSTYYDLCFYIQNIMIENNLDIAKFIKLI